jgi:hypothetical protein
MEADPAGVAVAALSPGFESKWRLKPSNWWMAFWWSEPQDVIPWVELLSEFTPQIYVRNTQSIVFELGRSRALIDEASLKVKIFEQKLNPKAMDGLTLPQFGAAANPGEALAKAHFQTDRKSELPTEALFYFLDPFREATNDLKSLRKILSDLKNLGLQRLGPFLELSEAEVGVRWSHWGKRLWLSANNFLPIVEPRIETNEVFEESYEFPEDAPGTLLEPLYFISKQLLQKLHTRLAYKNLGARSLRVILTGVTYEEDFSGTVEFCLTLPAFHHEVSLWLTLLRERLQTLAQQHKLPQIAEVLSIRIEETLSWQGLQKDLFDPHREQREGALYESLAKIESRLGREKIFCAEPRESYRPESSWTRRSSWDWYKRISQVPMPGDTSENGVVKIYEGLSQKPLQVFREPQKVVFRCNQILFNSRWESCRLIWCEIIAGEFWKVAFERRYGVGYLNGGEKLWLFKEGDTIYLQGVFL